MYTYMTLSLSWCMSAPAVTQSSGDVEKEFAHKSPLKRARTRRTRSMSKSRDQSPRARRNTVSNFSRGDRASGYTALRRMTSLGIYADPYQSRSGSRRVSRSDFLSDSDAGEKAEWRSRRTSVSMSHPMSQEYSKESERVEVNVTDGWLNKLVSSLEQGICSWCKILLFLPHLPPPSFSSFPPE